MAWSCEGVHLSDYFLCLTSDMLQQRQLTERIVPNQRATSLKAQLLHGKFDFPRRSLWSKKKLLSKAATVLLFFFAFWRMMHSDPLSPSFKKYMTVTTNVWIIMIQERSCASTCVNHMASNSFAQALAHAVAPHHGFNRRAVPLMFSPKHPQNERVLLHEHLYCMDCPEAEGICNWLLLNLWDRVKSQLAKSQNIAAVSTVFLGTGPQFGKKIDFSCTDPKSVGIPDVATCNKRCCIGSRKPGPCLRSLR